MSVVYVGALQGNSEEKFRGYVKTYFPLADIKRLSGEMGVKGLLANRIKRADVALVLLTEEDVAKYGKPAENALLLSNVIKYTDDIALEKYFKAAFSAFCKNGGLTDVLQGESGNEHENLQERILELEGMLTESASRDKDAFDKLNAEYSALNEERGRLEGKIKELEYQLSGVEELSKESDKVKGEYEQKIRQLEEKISESVEIKLELDGIKTERDGLSLRVRELEKKLSETVITDKQADIDKLKAEYTALQKERDSLGDIVSGLNEKLNTLEGLSAELEIAKTERDAFEKQAKEFETGERSAEEKTGVLQAELDAARDSETRLLRKAAAVSKELEETKAACMKLKEKARLSDLLSDELADVKAESEKKDSAIAVLNTDVGLLTAKVAHLTESHDIKRLTDELEGLRLLVDTDMQSEIEQVKKDLEEQIKKTEQSVEELEYKDRCYADLSEKVKQASEDLETKEIELKETNEKLEDLRTDMEKYAGVYGQFADNADPGGVINMSLGLKSNGVGGKMLVLGAGGSHSMRDLYGVVRRVADYSGKRVLILDLCADTHIDVVYHTKIKTAACWLQGQTPLMNVLSDTDVGTVKIVSLVNTYINMLYLLRVNWDKLFKEMNAAFEKVIICAGSLDSLISTVLYTEFRKIMNGRIITGGSAAALRSTYLHIRGLANLTEETVLCAEYRSDSKELCGIIEKRCKVVPIGLQGEIII